MDKYNRKQNITSLVIPKGLIKAISLSATLTVCMISNAYATAESAVEGLKVINSELLISSEHLNNDKCYHENMAYSQGALIVMKVDNEEKQFKCSSLNSYELNGKLGWKELGTKKGNKVKSKLTITRD